MLSRYPLNRVLTTCWFCVISCIILIDPAKTYAGRRGGGGGGGAFGSSAVGGVIVDANGVLRKNPQHDLLLRRDALLDLNLVPDGLDQTVQLRRVSLRRLQAAIDDSLRNNNEILPLDIQFLGGLQRIQYILVYPEEHDIVLAGPGEGWTIDDHGFVVGTTTGQPVIRLDDLLTAFRTVTEARTVGISCSINPRQEGLQQMQRLVASQKSFQTGIVSAIERALGPQTISITGVPASSNLALTLVAADYRMKRIAMGLDDSPIKSLPSYLSLVKSARAVKNMMPRWWLACDYAPLARGEGGLAWEIREPGVKCLTEPSFLDENGTVQKSRSRGHAAERWAEMMTTAYDELAQHDLIFTQLRNTMDLCVVAALIQQEGLLEQADFSLSLLTEPDGPLLLHKKNSPQTVASQASVVRRGRHYIIAASGGVEINSWGIASQFHASEQVEQLRLQAARGASESNWWWQ